jgi:hypothetical protein
MSMPQPSCVKETAGNITGSPVVQDSRLRDDGAACGGVAKQLAKAVASSPACVEMSWIMLVLAPMIAHHDREGEIVGWCSWRNRGWCRVEFMAAHLSRNEIMVMVVKGPENNPEFLFSGDALLLPPGQGQFSCCTVNHDFGNGNGNVPCDRSAVRSILTTLSKAKIVRLREQGDWFRMRYIVALEHHYCQGLENGDRLGSYVSLSKIQSTKAVQSLLEPGIDQKENARLEGLKHMMGWRGDVEGAPEERKKGCPTGVSLLHWATLADDLPAVRELLRVSTINVNHSLVKSRPGPTAEPVRSV